jgi:hypothetical protein
MAMSLRISTKIWSVRHEEKSERRKEHPLKKTWWQRFNGSSAHTQANIVCTIVIAVATCAYAFIAYRQLGVINGQLTQMKNATTATENSAYAACVGAKIARDTLLDIRNSLIDTHASALATVEQDAANVESEKAIMSINPRFPAPADLVDHQLVIPYSIKNDGRSAILRADYWMKAVLLDNGDSLHFDSRNMIHGRGKYMPAGAEYPGKPDPGFRPLTPSVVVRDNAERVVPDTSQGAKDFFSGNREIVFIYGHLAYTDFFGTHRVKFCTPQYAVNPGTTHNLTKSERVCGAYNHQQDQYSQMPTIQPLPPVDTDRIEAIKCVAPTN